MTTNNAPPVYVVVGADGVPRGCPFRSRAMATTCLREADATYPPGRPHRVVTYVPAVTE